MKRRDQICLDSGTTLANALALGSAVLSKVNQDEHDKDITATIDLLAVEIHNQIQKKAGK